MVKKVVVIHADALDSFVESPMSGLGYTDAVNMLQARERAKCVNECPLFPIGG